MIIESRINRFARNNSRCLLLLVFAAYLLW